MPCDSKADDEAACNPLLPQPHSRSRHDPGADAARSQGVGSQHQKAGHFLRCAEARAEKLSGKPSCSIGTCLERVRNDGVPWIDAGSSMASLFVASSVLESAMKHRPAQIGISCRRSPQNILAEAITSELVCLPGGVHIVQTRAVHHWPSPPNANATSPIEALFLPPSFVNCSA